MQLHSNQGLAKVLKVGGVFSERAVRLAKPTKALIFLLHL